MSLDIGKAVESVLAAVEKPIAAFYKRLYRHGEELQELREEIAALKNVQPIPGERGSPGSPGKDADEDAITASVLNVVMSKIAEIPVPKDGEPGRDGKDGADADEDAITASVLNVVMSKIAEIPVPKDGEPGRDGKDGADADEDAITASVVAQVTEVLKSIPVPKDGKDGTDGTDGKDGVGLAGALIDRAGELVVTLTDGTQRILGPVVGKDGEAGKSGADALGFDDLSVEFDGERSFKFVMVRGELRKEFGPFSAPWPLDRGVWKEGAYAKGDAVTWGGSSWIAQRDTSEKPETSDAWRLAVKRGRDGKDGVLKQATELKTVKVC